MPASHQPLYNAIKAKILLLLPELTRLKQERTLKADDSYVTQADILVQETLHSLITTCDPKALLVSEEDLASHGTTALNGSVYVLDPIDGTENFTSGLPEWGISLSHYSNGKHVASMLACPELGYWLQSGESWPRFTSRIRGLSSSLGKNEFEKLENGIEYRIMGCCVYNLLSVLRGSFQSFENPKGANTWDILAGLNLALEAGLQVSVDGKAYTGELLPPGKKYRFKISNP
jgi:fructose-1,6-bisphosphatase/inositol monophosphatase family enzyme